MAIKELFLISALALPNGSFREPPNTKVRVFHMMKEVIYRHYRQSPRILFIEHEQLQLFNWQWIKGSETRPPWKDNVFHIVYRKQPYEHNNFFANRLSLKKITPLITPYGFLIIDIHSDPKLTKALFWLGYKKLTVTLMGYNFFQKDKSRPHQSYRLLLLAAA